MCDRAPILTYHVGGGAGARDSAAEGDFPFPKERERVLCFRVFNER